MGLTQARWRTDGDGLVPPSVPPASEQGHVCKKLPVTTNNQHVAWGPTSGQSQGPPPHGAACVSLKLFPVRPTAPLVSRSCPVPVPGRPSHPRARPPRPSIACWRLKTRQTEIDAGQFDMTEKRDSARPLSEHFAHGCWATHDSSTTSPHVRHIIRSRSPRNLPFPRGQSPARLTRPPAVSPECCWR